MLIVEKNKWLRVVETYDGVVIQYRTLLGFWKNIRFSAGKPFKAGFELFENPESAKKVMKRLKSRGRSYVRKGI